MKNYLMLLGLFFSLLLSAQTPLPIMPKPTEPDVPTVIEAEAAEFLKTFEKLVQYLADKNNNYTDKVYHAQIFAKKFKQGAVIEIKNGKRTIPLTPLEYFHRLIDLKYDQVVIKFENIKNNGIKRTVQNQYKSQYLIKQITDLIDKNKVIYADYTIKTIDMFFIYTPQTKTWTKQFGNVHATYTQRTQ